MPSTQSFIFALELVGTAAFAASGAQMGVRKNMDILGMLVLALTIDGLTRRRGRQKMSSSRMIMPGLQR